ncbi:DUF7504 family protein [Halobiforma nitratireducens]|uniref:Uncharacterized protein n=1 Tax=Halobiforma nitratireducens JCM 10879 TaxID=1227454 RepID=M0M0B8_9EURY|nr:hypothetical protein [Halobiforma nitratireducens]EMA39116.1 hypothetical protein C446_08998 [Halobiforma nitratireducens JCM 10879]
MGTEIGTEGTRGTDLGTFARTLETMKREGCNVLLVGSGAADCHAAVCRRLCGAAGPEPRRRLFVTDGETIPAAAAGTDGGARAAEAPTDGCANDPANATTIQVDDGDSLGEIGIEVVEAIDDLEGDVGGFEPAELRLCTDVLAGLLRDHDTERVFRLLHVIVSRVDHVDGMGHYHLPLERDHDAVNLLEPLFDAVVELRVRDQSQAGAGSESGDAADCEQRWFLRDGGTTDWISL